MENIVVTGIRGLPLIKAGDNIAAMICERVTIEDGDIVSIASTIYSKAEGYTKSLAEISPSPKAVRLGKLNGEDPRFVQAVLDASKDIIMEHPFILSESPFGHIGVRAGVDQSNIDDGMVIFLPPDPMAAAAKVRDEIRPDHRKKRGCNYHGHLRAVIPERTDRACNRMDRVHGYPGFPGRCRPVRSRTKDYRRSCGG